MGFIRVQYEMTQNFHYINTDLIEEFYFETEEHFLLDGMLALKVVLQIKTKKQLVRVNIHESQMKKHGLI